MSAPRRHAFTLMETMLAAALGALVILIVTGIVTVMDRAESGSADRLARTTEMEQAQIVIRRAIGSMAMAGGNAPVSQTRTPEQAARDGVAPVSTVTYTPTPRLVLAPMSVDPMLAAQTAVGVTTTTTGTDERVSAAGELSISASGSQRLMLALTSLPLPEQTFLASRVVSRTARGSTSAGTSAATTPMDEDVEDPFAEAEAAAEAAAAEESSEESSEMVPIFWGVFELTPPGPAPDAFGNVPVHTEAASGADPVKEGWTLWWRRIEPPVNPASAALLSAAALVAGGESTTSAMKAATAAVSSVTSQLSVDPRNDPSAVPLIRGLQMCRWSVYRGRSLLPGYTATYSGELPAYVQLELRTTSGVYANWMFEVGWATVREPGQIEASRLNQALTRLGDPSESGLRGAGGPGGERGGVRGMQGGGGGDILRRRRDVGEAPADRSIQRPRRGPEGGGR